MRTKIAFQECADTIVSQVREHWAGQEAPLCELIGAERHEDTQLDLRVHRQEQTNRYSVRAILALPSATLAAAAVEENATAALDRVTELLAQAVQQHHRGTSPVIEAIDEVEVASAESFPASDAPAWTRMSV